MNVRGQLPDPGRASRRRRTAATAAAAAVIALLAAGCSSEAGIGSGGGTSGDAVSAPGMDVGTQVDHKLPADLLHLPLTDQDGKRTSLAAYRGKALVVSDVMTLCAETCPLDTANLVQTAQQADADHAGSKVEFLSITIDPARDTPAQLSAYRRMYAPAPANWQALTGSPAVVQKLWKYFGVWYQKVPQDSPTAKNWRTGQPLTYDLNHSDEIFFIDPRGRERFVIDGAGHVQPGTVLPPAMKKYLDSDGLNNLNHPDTTGTWTVHQGVDTLSWLLQHRLPYHSAAA